MTVTNRRLLINAQTKPAKLVYRNPGQNVAESFHSKTFLYLTVNNPTRARCRQCRRLDVYLNIISKDAAYSGKYKIEYNMLKLFFA